MESYHFLLTYDFDQAHQTKENFQNMDEGLKKEDWLQLKIGHSFILEVEASNYDKAVHIAEHSVEHAYNDNAVIGNLSLALQVGMSQVSEFGLG